MVGSRAPATSRGSIMSRKLNCCMSGCANSLSWQCYKKMLTLPYYDMCTMPPLHTSLAERDLPLPQKSNLQCAKGWTATIEEHYILPEYPKRCYCYTSSSIKNKPNGTSPTYVRLQLCPIYSYNPTAVPQPDPLNKTEIAKAEHRPCLYSWKHLHSLV